MIIFHGSHLIYIYLFADLAAAEHQQCFTIVFWPAYTHFSRAAFFPCQDVYEISAKNVLIKSPEIASLLCLNVYLIGRINYCARMLVLCVRAEGLSFSD